MSEWRPAWQPAEPDIEAVRLIAFELVWDEMHFHERAIADPFEAEAFVHDVGRRLLIAVGYPTGTQQLMPSPELPPPSVPHDYIERGLGGGSVRTKYPHEAWPPGPFRRLVSKLGLSPKRQPKPKNGEAQSDSS